MNLVKSIVAFGGVFWVGKEMGKREKIGNDVRSINQYWNNHWSNHWKEYYGEREYCDIVSLNPPSGKIHILKDKETIQGYLDSVNYSGEDYNVTKEWVTISDRAAKGGRRDPNGCFSYKRL